MKKPTQVVHPQTVQLKQGNTPLISPVHHSVKYQFRSVQQMRESMGSGEAYFYSRAGNPTVRELELAVAQLQDRPDALAVSSGMAALSTCLMTLLNQGDHMVLALELYKPTRVLAERLLERWGVSHSVVSIRDFGALEAAFADSQTRLFLFESPSNPMLFIADIERLTGLAQAHAVTTVLDNTFAGLHNHGKYDIDYFVHSLTKYASGHGDVMGGAIIGPAAGIGLMRHTATYMGPVLDPNAAFLISRGLRTYFVRHDRQCENAMTVAAWLNEQSDVRNVRFPGLPEAEGHQLATRQMDDFGTMVSFDVAGDADNMIRFLDALTLFPLCASLGSTESLVAPCKMFYAMDLNRSQLAQAAISETTVRLSIGIEAVEDLCADLEQALQSAFSANSGD